jgi:His/Glu/Gln/Arg/opine family amino acid ABC transporter permease subunit
MSDIPSAASPAFVRHDQIPPSPPPSGTGGIVAWLQQNLFNGVLNSILTVVAVVCIYFLIAGALPWLASSIWNTDSLKACREVLDGATGACFSVLTERWNQLLFGISYPADLYWRPTLAFVLLFVAAAPVLFFDLPRKLLIFTGLYPFLAYWLIWGGAFWVPLLLIVGFALTYYVHKLVLSRKGDGPALGAAFVTMILWFGLIFGALLDGIDRTVGSARMASVQERITAEIDAAPGQIAKLQGEAEILDGRVTEALAAARDNGSAEVIKAAYSATADDRAQLGELRREIGLMRNALSEQGNLLNRINALPEVEASLPTLREKAAELRAALPASVAAVTSSDGRDVLEGRNRDEELGITLEDFRALDEALAADASVRSAELSVERTYADVARIGLKPVSSDQIGGFMLNMILGVTCVSLSLPLGIMLALGRQSKMPIIRNICVVFIEFIRGVPLITLLFIANVVLAYFLPPGTTFDLILRVMIMITLFSSAYIAEVIRGGLAALPRGQYEAGDSLGLDYPQSMRLIILPQALKISIPGIVNIAVGLFKDTTLVSVISMFDLVGMIRGPVVESAAWKGIYWELFMFASVLFFIICYGISQYSQWLERRLATDHR